MRVGVRSVLCCFMVAACGGHSLDVGSNDSGVVTGSAAMLLLPLGPLPDANMTKQVWTGHLVKDQFPDGSNTLTMPIEFGPGGQVTGSILLGNGAILAPPTDPDIGYPPGGTGVVSPVEGFPYAIQNAALVASHLTLQFAENEVWTQWCALQTSYPACPDGPGCDAGVYGCQAPPPVGSPSESEFGWGPNGCGYFFPDGSLSIDCAKATLCGGGPPGGVCQCSVTGCQVGSPGQFAFLDLVLADAKADGTLSGPFGDYPVQFTRSL
jgi:hypothetical protein